MSVSLAYGLAIVIWSTTPLAIVFSNDSIAPLMSAFLRMTLAAMLGSVLLKLMGLKLSCHWRALKAYLASVVGIFGAMAATYQAAQWIPSGLISVLFGLTTIVTGLLGHFLLENSRLSLKQWAAVFMGLAGLAVVFTDQILVSGFGIKGILFSLLAVFLFSISNVLMKIYGGHLHPLQQTVGALWVSLPFYALACLVTGTGLVISEITMTSVAGVTYLAVFGSLVGFVAYFYLISHLSPAYVSLITLITPVLALMLGNQLNNEPVTIKMLSGAAIILLSMLFFMGDHFRVAAERRKSTELKTDVHTLADKSQ